MLCAKLVKCFFLLIIIFCYFCFILYIYIFFLNARWRFFQLPLNGLQKVIRLVIRLCFNESWHPYSRNTCHVPEGVPEWKLHCILIFPLVLEAPLFRWHCYVLTRHSTERRPHCIHRSSKAKKFGNLSIREILVTAWPYFRPSICLHQRDPVWKLFNQCGSVQPVIAYPCCWQLSKQGIP